MNRAIVFFILLTSAFSLNALVALGSDKVAPKEISIYNMKFSPEVLVLKKGESIQWVNKDVVPHTVTADDGSFDSKNIEPGKSWIYQPKTVKKSTYKCNYHPTMKASFSIE